MLVVDVLGCTRGYASDYEKTSSDAAFAEWELDWRLPVLISAGSASGAFAQRGAKNPPPPSKAAVEPQAKPRVVEPLWPVAIAGAAARRDSAGEAHRRVLRQSALEAHGHPRRDSAGRDAREARSRGRGVERGRSVDAGAAGAALHRRRRAAITPDRRGNIARAWTAR